MKKPKQRIKHRLFEHGQNALWFYIIQAIGFAYFDMVDTLRLETENSKSDMNEVWIEMHVCKHQ